jgi:hypothetical protein
MFRVQWDMEIFPFRFLMWIFRRTYHCIVPTWDDACRVALLVEAHEGCSHLEICRLSEGE